MSKQVSFSLLEDECDSGFSHSDFITRRHTSNISYRQRYSMDPQQSPVQDGSSSQNQTGSTNDSRNEGSTTQLSSPSNPRGFSSDDWSGMRSETETSDGNISMSQYPLDDRSGDESPNPAGESIHDELLTSAITEVSKDFMSGKFSPLKCPAGSGDSDSYSDGDVKSQGDHKGAVYANYPESATGMSDCDWNPYESDNPEFTPRSGSSEMPIQNPALTALTGQQQLKESGYGSYKDTGSTVTTTQSSLTKGNNIKSATRNEDKGSDTGSLSDAQSGSGGESDRASSASASSKSSGQGRQQVQHFSASFGTKPGAVSVDALQNAGGNGQTRSRSDRRDSGGELPDYNPQERTSQDSAQTNNGSQPVLILRQSQEELPSNGQVELRRTADSVNFNSQDSAFSAHSIDRREAGSLSTNSASDRALPVGVSSSDGSISKFSDRSAFSSRDPMLKRSSSDTNSGKPIGKEPVYVPITERDQLLGLAESLSVQEASPREQDSQGNHLRSDADSRTYSGDKSSSTASSVIQSNQLSKGDVPPNLRGEMPPNEDALAQRVNKLLSQASTLGASLHKQLYSREALGLTNEDGDLSRFQPLTPDLQPDESSSMITMSNTPGITDRKQGLSMDDSEVQPRNVTTLTDNLSRSEQSLMSSLGDEVAKLLARTEAAGVEIPKSEEMKITSGIGMSINKELGNESSDLESVQRYYRQEKETERLLKETQSRLSIASSSDSSDALGSDVKNVLARTSHIDKMSPIPVESTGIDNNYASTNLDYSRLQNDLQEIQNSLNSQSAGDATGRIRSLGLDASLSDKTGDTTNPESARNRNMIWDHAADIGIDNSANGVFMGTTKTDYTDTENTFGQSRPASKDFEDTRYSHDHLTTHTEDVENITTSNLAPDVEAIIERYQKSTKVDRDPEGQEDTSGLASRVFTILTHDPPQKQAFGILEEAMEQEREIMQRIVNQPKMDSSYDSYSLNSADGSFLLRDKDIKKQLDWSQISSLDNTQHPDKTAISELSFLKGGKVAPFSSLGNARTFLSSQLQKTSDRTFDHSIELRTPYRNVIQCYPVYGAEQKPEEGKRQTEPVREAWADSRPEHMEDKPSVPNESRPTVSTLRDTVTPRLANERFFLTDMDNTPPRDRQRHHSDPRDLSPEYRMSPEDRHRPHIRSRSEEASSLDSDLASSRRAASSQQGMDDKRSSKRDSDGHPHRQETYGGNSPKSVRRKRLLKRRQRDRSPSSSGGVISPNDSDNSSHRREGPKLRPYRPYGSRDLYYTEDGDDSGSLVDSVTTVESTHADYPLWQWSSPDFICKSNLFDFNYRDSRDFRNYQDYSYMPYIGSDDAIGPSLPSHLLGSRSDPLSASGIYSNGQAPKGLSTIEEKSIADDKDKSSVDSGLDRRSEIESLVSRGDVKTATEQRPESGLDLQVGKYRTDITYPERQAVRDGGYERELPLREVRPRSSEYLDRNERETPVDDVHNSGDLGRDQRPTSLGSMENYRTRETDRNDRDLGFKDGQGRLPTEGYRSTELGLIATTDRDLGPGVRSTELGLISNSDRDLRPHSGGSGGGSLATSDLDYRQDKNLRRTERYNEPFRGDVISRTSSEDRYSRQEETYTGRYTSDIPARRTDNIGISEDYHRYSTRDNDLLRRYPDTAYRYDVQYAGLGPSLSRRDPLDSHLYSNVPEFKEDNFSKSSRSDPGELFIAPMHDKDLVALDRDPLANQGLQEYSRDLIGQPRLRSKSETDLNDLSVETHRNSSPMHGDKLMEFSKLSYQPSPIFSHHASMESPAFRHTREDPYQGLPVQGQMTRSDDYKHITERIMQRPLEKGSDYPRDSERISRDVDYASRYRPRSLDDEGHLRSDMMSNIDKPSSIQPTATYCDKTGKPLESQEIPRPLEPGRGLEGQPLEPGPGYPMSRSSGHSSRHSIEPLSTHTLPEPTTGDEAHFRELEPLPDSDFEEEVAKEREKLIIERREQLIKEMEMNARAKHGFIPLIGEEEADLGAEIDKIPPSKKVHILRETLEKEYRDRMRPDINDMWQQFQNMNQAPSDQSSNMDTPRLEGLTNLIQNPTRHVVQKLMDDKTYDRVKEEKLLKELAQMDEEQKKIQAEKRKREIERRRREAEHRRRISESESNGSYAEILAQQEQRKKKDSDKVKKDKDNKNVGVKQTRPQKPMDSTDTLYSIPEDTSFDGTSPAVKERDVDRKSKAKHSRHRHVIDPLMNKLRDKVQHQREKIDKERRREMKRMDKLKKLEMLLNAKQKGKLSDKAIDAELEMVSSTTANFTSDSSTLMDTDSTAMTEETTQTAATIDTSSKDSSIYKQFPASKMKGGKQYEQFLSSPMKGGKQVSIKEPRRVTKKTKDIWEDSESQNDVDSIFDRPQRLKQESKKGAEKHSKKKTKKVKDSDIYTQPTKSQINKENVERFLAQMDPDQIFEEKPRRSSRSPIMEAARRLKHSKSPVYDRVRESSRSPVSRRSPVSHRSPSSRKSREVGINVPSPIVISPPTRRKKSKKVYMVSEAVQTSPSVYSRTHNECGVIPVPLMSPDRNRKRQSPSPVRKSSRSPTRHMTSKYRSPVSSPERSRSRPMSAKHRSSHSSPDTSRLTSFSIPSRSLSRSKSRERRKSPSPDRTYKDIYEMKGKPPPKSRMFTPETPDDTCIAKLKDSPSRGVSWYIPADGETKPWRKPFKEQKANAVRQQPWQPKGIHPADWKAMVNSDVLENVSRDTMFDLDPEGRRINRQNEDGELGSSDEENHDPKSLTKMSLQEAFLLRKQSALSRLRERQKLLKLAQQERQLQNYLEQERNTIFTEKFSKKDPNPEAHPYSENLHKPKRRIMSKQEMKELTKRLYKKLPEVQAMKQVKKRDNDYSLNRLKARVFNRKVQCHVLKANNR